MRLFIIMLSVIVSSNSLAWTTETSDNIWRSGWGQGVSEAEVTYGSGNTIYVACTDPDNLTGGSSISISLGGDTIKNGEILAIFDNDKPENFKTNSDGLIESASRVGASQFTYIVNKFKKHNKVYIRFSNGKEATFTLKGASKAISSDCKAAFYY